MRRFSASSHPIIIQAVVPGGGRVPFKYEGGTHQTLVLTYNEVGSTLSLPSRVFLSLLPFWFVESTRASLCVVDSWVRGGSEPSRSNPPFRKVFTTDGFRPFRRFQNRTKVRRSRAAVSGRVIINRSPNPYVPWIEECSPWMREKAIEIGLCLLLEHPSRFLLSLDKIMAKIEGTGSVTSIMKARRESEEVRHAGGNDPGI